MCVLERGRRGGSKGGRKEDKSREISRYDSLFLSSISLSVGYPLMMGGFLHRGRAQGNKAPCGTKALSDDTRHREKNTKIIKLRII